jgi:Ca2+-transporting ATPase
MADFAFTADDLSQLFDDRQVADLNKKGGLKAIAKGLATNLETGLNEQQLSEEGRAVRVRVFGANKTDPPPAKTLFELMLEALEDATLKILIVAALVSLALGFYENPASGWIEGTAILVAVVIVVLVTSLNDYSKEQQFRRLSQVADDKLIKVMRCGSQQQVSVYDLIVGDVVELGTGDEIPADGLVFGSHNMKVDESSMTGESDAIKKGDNEPFLISGTPVTEGVGRMLVVAVGPHSQKGKIKALLQKDQEDTPLQEKLEIVAAAIGNLGLVVAILTLSVLVGQFGYRLYSTGQSFELHMLEELIGFVITAITIVVVAVPEGLPLAVTISLAYSMMKMLKDNNLVRHLDACETMGGATNICSDKTGTLTENRMTVTHVWLGRKMYGNTLPTKDDLASEVHTALVDGISINSTAYITKNKEKNTPEFIGSKTECALLGFVEKLSGNYDKVRQTLKINQLYPFSSERKRMSILLEAQDNVHRLYTKGASEIVLQYCDKIVSPSGEVTPLSDEEKEEIRVDVIENFASQGLRTICLAYGDVSPQENPEEPPEQGLTCIGIVGIKDPVRKEVPAAVAECKKAGITVRMVTGDNILTAKKIAEECGIFYGEGIAMEGREFRQLSEEDMGKVVPKLQVLARSSPSDKYILVSYLRKLGEVVAVTGDGTNDAPALKESDVGFSMGISGTDVAKEASDIVLLDDNFTSIVAAVMWGRNVYDSIRKFLQFQLTVNLVALLIAFVSAVTTGESVLTPVQLLWVNLIMDTMGALALATEQPTKDLLHRKPYGRHDFLITKQMWCNIIGQSIFQAIVLFFVLYRGESFFGVVAHSLEHTTIVFNTFVLCQVVNEINSRKIDHHLNVFSGILRNHVFLGILVFTLLFQYVIVEFGGSFTATTHLTSDQWTKCAGIALLGFPVGVIIRLLSRPFLQTDPITKQTVEVDPAIVKMMWHKVKRASVHMEITEDVEKRRANKFKDVVQRKIQLNRMLKEAKGSGRDTEPKKQK